VSRFFSNVSNFLQELAAFLESLLRDFSDTSCGSAFLWFFRNYRFLPFLHARSIAAKRMRLQLHLFIIFPDVENTPEKRRFWRHYDYYEYNAHEQNENSATVKKEIFTALGSDYTLKDKKLNVSLDNLLFPIRNGAEEVRRITEKLEPKKKLVNTKDMGEIYAQNPSLLPACG
jgi:hypothetical protein